MRLDRRTGLAVLAALATAGCGGRTYLGQGHGDGGAAVEPGDASCDPATEYCRRMVGGPPPGVDVRSCEALSAGCHACDCLIAPGCTCLDDTGHLSLTCDVP